MDARHFSVTLPSPFEDGAEVCFTDDASQWRSVAGEFRQDDVIRIPRELVASSARVPDEARYVVEPDGSLTPCTPDISGGGVVMVLESPHRSEFAPGLRAIRPLNGPSTNRLVERHLPALLTRAGELAGVRLAGRHVVLVNAIQYQCSLHHFMSQETLKLQGKVRDRVWLELFADGGSQDLMRRIEACKPALVLLAPTKGIRQQLVDWMGAARRPWPWSRVTRHPAGWATRPAIGELAPDRTLVVLPAELDGAFQPVHFPTC